MLLNVAEMAYLLGMPAHIDRGGPADRIDRQSIYRLANN